jgi:hypothetical protein
MKKFVLLCKSAALALAALLVSGLSVSPAAAAPGLLTLSQNSGVPGTYVAISGSGWSSATTTITSVTFDSILIAGTIAVVGGNFNTAFAVPTVPRGPHTISVTSNVPESTSTNFTVTPVVIGSATTGKVGDQITVVGNGFNASSSVSLYLDSTLAGTATTDIYGSFQSVSLAIPEIPAGNHVINASDSAGQATPAGFTISPKLTASALGAAVGGQLTISGKGYAANSPLTITLDSTPIPAGLTTNAVGSLAATAITIPAIAAGPHTLKVQDSLGNNSIATLTTTAALKTAPISGPVGSSVSVTGNGYLPKTKISLTYNGGQIQTNPSSITADDNGNFSASFIVPNTAAGNFIVAASDGTNSANTTFRSTAAGSLPTGKGSVGDAIQITGGGFTAGGNVSIKYDNVQIATAQADNGGALSTSVVIPPSQAGDHKIIASDGTNSITLTFTVTPAAALATTSGIVGSAATISGSGFLGGASIAVQFDGAQVAKSNADSQGTLSVVMTVPATSSGAHKIVVSDGVNSISLAFNVTPSASSSLNSGPVGSAITISGSAFRSAATISIKFDNADVASAAADAAGSFSVTFKAPTAAGGNHIISASDGATTKTFNFAIDNTAPSAPALVQPSSGGKADALASFEWTPVTDPNGGITYTFQLASDANFTLLLVNQSGLSSNTLKLIEAQKLKSAGKDKPYYWRVKAVDAASNASPWSDPLTFTVGFQMPTFAWWLFAVFAAFFTFLLGLFVGRKTARR